PAPPSHPASPPRPPPPPAGPARPPAAPAPPAPPPRSPPARPPRTLPPEASLPAVPDLATPGPYGTEASPISKHAAATTALTPKKPPPSGPVPAALGPDRPGRLHRRGGQAFQLAELPGAVRVLRPGLGVLPGHGNLRRFQARPEQGTAGQVPDLDPHAHRPGDHLWEPDPRLLAHREQRLPDRHLRRGG